MTAPTDQSVRSPGRTVAIIAVALASVLVAAVLAVLVTRGAGPGEPGTSGDPGSPGEAAARAASDPRAFLDTYVDDDGRVVRLDQGGDTVSEGQAYGMLVAAGVDDQETFDRIWSWTGQTLLRQDGLFSWRWADGAVQDPSSAADADLDVARALLVAAELWDEPAYADDALVLGEAILDHETAEVPEGLVLTAGSWATEGNDEGPWAFNPSYVSPVATTMLGEASGDPRWAELEAGSRAAVDSVVDDATLPPDWAEIDASGAVRAVPGPGGLPVQFGYDAARTLLRHAESCDAADREIAVEALAALGEDPAVATYDLAGSPRTTDRSPLTLVAQAAGEAAAGDDGDAVAAIGEAADAQGDAPTYYGDAWAVLGPMLLRSDDLGGCAALGSA